MFSILIFFVTALGVVFMVWPRYETLLVSQAEFKQKEFELQNQQEYIRSLQELKGKVDSKSEQIAVVEESLPDTASLPLLYELLGTLGSQSGLIVKTVSLDAGSSSKPSSFSTIHATVDAEGNYEALKNFLISAKKSARILTVNNIALATTAKSNIFHFSILLEAYSH